MVRYIGPKIKIVRRLGVLPGLTRKAPKNRLKTPGEHGKMLFAKTRRSSLSDDYKNRLVEKQKLRFNYGVTEKQLSSYYVRAKKVGGATGTIILKLLESRLDCVIFRLGFAPTIPAARQLVNHRHIQVNNNCVNIPSFQCEKGDIFSPSKKRISNQLIWANLETQQKKRKLIKRRMKRINLLRSRFHTLLPFHLRVSKKRLAGKFVNAAKRKDFLVRVNELRVIEYYSR